MSAPNAATHPTPEELLREAPTICRWLRHYGVPEVDLDDATAETIAAAWLGVDRGSYQPDPVMPPRAALLCWLRGIAWRQGATALGRAFRRREVPIEHMPKGRAMTIEGELQARDELSLLDGLAPERRETILLYALGCGAPEIAAKMSTCESTVWSRLRQARLDLLAILRREAARGRMISRRPRVEVSSG